MTRGVAGLSLTPLERKLLGRLQAAERKRHKRSCCWNGQYGTGAGMAHRSVEFAACPVCKSGVGQLCVGPNGFKLATHYKRMDAYRQLAAKVRMAAQSCSETAP